MVFKFIELFHQIIGQCWISIPLLKVLQGHTIDFKFVYLFTQLYILLVLFCGLEFPNKVIRNRRHVVLFAIMFIQLLDSRRDIIYILSVSCIIHFKIDVTIKRHLRSLHHHSFFFNNHLLRCRKVRHVLRWIIIISTSCFHIDLCFSCCIFIHFVFLLWLLALCKLVD